METIKIITIIIMSTFYIGIGLAHFIIPDNFIILIPPSFPSPIILVYVSGFFEILFGVLLLIKKFRFYAGVGLILLLIAVFPANIFLYINQEVREAYGVISQEQALVRMFFQLPLVLIAYWHSRITEPIWFSYLCGAVSIPTIIYFINLLF